MSGQISEKENLLRALRREDPHHVPVRRMNGVIPGMVKVYYPGARMTGPGLDPWGVRWEGGAPAGQEWEPMVQPYAVGHPLTDFLRVEEYPMPNPPDERMMAGLVEGIDRAQYMLAGEMPLLLFERAHTLTGMENLMMAMLEDPEAVVMLLGRIADYDVRVLESYIELGMEAVRCQDDYGGQGSLLMSPRLWRRLIKPPLARLYKLAKDAGLIVFHHSCGNIMEIVPDLIEIGVDVIDSVQPRVNDRAKLKRVYGDRLSFMGGMDTTTTLSQGTPEEIEEEVKVCLRSLGAGGGYILGPDNLIPIPERCYRAYLAAGERLGRYPLQV
ncbi:MAG: uroporphyrinogen decarboxylase family protein [Terriglobia bacterium]